jgi:hypothetical protein
MSKVEVNQISSQCGSTLTIGQSGDTVTLAAGATQSGFGRTGTVDWDTTAKTASFTASNGEGYFVNTTSGAITVTLPATPSSGDIVSVSDYNGTAATNAITIARNGSNINGDAANYVITKADSAITFVYVDATVGWTSVQTSNTADNKNPFIIATGGTITECGDYKIHTFTGPGTFTVTQASSNCTAENTVGYVVVAGGGSGGAAGTSVTGGGGGAGGFREGRNVPIDNFTASPLVANAPTNSVTIAAGSYPIIVGAGGAGIPGPGSPDTAGNTGSNSIFSTITSTGGGGGGSNNQCATAGGSGGGGKESDGAGGAGNTPPVSPPQGQNGGAGSEAGNSSGGGGGAGAAGCGPTASNGGNGVSSSITGSSVTRAGGGAANAGSGGSGGGGDAGGSPNFPIPSIGNGQAGTANTGGGGGGSITCNNSGAGGSGIVIIRYKFQ